MTFPHTCPSPRIPTPFLSHHTFNLQTMPVRSFSKWKDPPKETPVKWGRIALVVFGVSAVSLGTMVYRVEAPWSSQVTALSSAVTARPDQIDSLQSRVRTVQDQIIRFEDSRYVALQNIDSLKSVIDRNVKELREESWQDVLRLTRLPVWASDVHDWASRVQGEVEDQWSWLFGPETERKSLEHEPDDIEDDVDELTYDKDDLEDYQDDLNRLVSRIKKDVDLLHRLMSERHHKEG